MEVSPLMSHLMHGGYKVSIVIHDYFPLHYV